MLGAFDLRSQLPDSAVAFYLGSTSPDVRATAAEMLACQPPLVVGSGQHRSKSPQLYEEKMALLKTPHLQVTLGASDFTAMMMALLGSSSAGDTSSTGGVEAHLERCAGSHSLPSRLVMEHKDYRAYWIGYHLAQFCVNNKLKTPLGKPQDTLTSIEKALRNSNQVLMNGNGDVKDASMRVRCKVVQHDLNSRLVVLRQALFCTLFWKTR